MEYQDVEVQDIGSYITTNQTLSLLQRHIPSLSNRHPNLRPSSPNQRPNHIHNPPPSILALLLKKDMNLLPALRRVKYDTPDLRATPAKDLVIAVTPHLKLIVPGGGFGGTSGDELDDGVGGGLEVDVFGGGVVDGGDGGVGEDWGVG